MDHQERIHLHLLQGSNSHWETSACKLHQQLMHTKDFPVVDCSKMQCCGASVSVASEKKTRSAFKHPLLKGGRKPRTPWQFSYFSYRTLLCQNYSVFKKKTITVLLFSLIPTQPTTPLKKKPCSSQRSNHEEKKNDSLALQIP